MALLLFELAWLLLETQILRDQRLIVALKSFYSNFASRGVPLSLFHPLYCTMIAFSQLALSLPPSCPFLMNHRVFRSNQCPATSLVLSLVYEACKTTADSLFRANAYAGLLKRFL